ncbi:MAG: BREX-3 system phosphatase PglZ, partial [Chloroflexota bacterium]
EGVILALAQRGFQVIQENDTVLLRQRVEEARPFDSQHPLLVISVGMLEDLAYDLYQPAYRLTLSLHDYFPNLAYPVLQTLSPEQVERLAACQPVAQPLSRQKTIDYLLRAVFEADAEALCEAPALIAWLSAYHQRQSPLPPLLWESLLERLRRFTVYQNWDIKALVDEPQAFKEFVQQEWKYAVTQAVSGKPIQEAGGKYHLIFEGNPHLQDLLPALIRQGSLQPVEVQEVKTIPSWAHCAVTQYDSRQQRFNTLLDALNQQVSMLQSGAGANLTWHTWKDIGRDWAEINALRYQNGIESSDLQRWTYQQLIQKVDAQFYAYLQKVYSPLGALRLPEPHHVHHIPHYLAYLRNLAQTERIALVVLDGLSLCDWHIVHSVWSERHPDWEYTPGSLLAQIPTLTSISRYALVSGLRPAEFAADLNHCPTEANAWKLFWSREGLPQTACGYKAISFDRGVDCTPELEDPRVHFWCLIEVKPDELVHNAVLGSADQQASLRLWLDPHHEPNAAALERLIDQFLERQFSVFITSDHGHVEALGMGQPSEGLLAQTRGKRARIYNDQRAAIHVKNVFEDTLLWQHDGILPDDLSVLMPLGRKAFAPSGEMVVTHGGVTLDEVLVPFVQIKKVSVR